MSQCCVLTNAQKDCAAASSTVIRHNAKISIEHNGDDESNCGADLSLDFWQRYDFSMVMDLKLTNLKVSYMYTEMFVMDYI